MFIYVVGLLFLASVLFVAFEDFLFKTSTLKNRLSESLFVYIKNPICFFIFLVRAFFLLSDEKFVAIGVQFLYLPCVIFIGKFCIDLCMRNDTVRNWHTIHVSDSQKLKIYWTTHLMTLTWALRFFYGVILVYGCFHVYELAESLNKDLLEDEQLFEQSQETLIKLDKLWFSLQAFVTTLMCQLTAQVMVAYMLPEIQKPMMQTCRYCVTSAGTIVFVCGGAGLLACDLPAFQPNEPNAVNDMFRSFRGLPLFESAAGMLIFQNIQFLVKNGDIDLTLITDPTTGRVSDELMCLHLKTTYKQLIIDKCSPGFALKYASPESLVTKACQQMSADFTQWIKKKLSLKGCQEKSTLTKK